MDQEYVADMWRFIYPRIFTLNRQLHSAIETALGVAGLDTGRPYIAVHIRHGDKYKEASILESKSYAEAAKNLLRPQRRSSSSLQALLNVVAREMKAKSATQVYVSSDDELAAQEMQTSLGENVTIIRQPPVSNETYEDRDYV